MDGIFRARHRHILFGYSSASSDECGGRSRASVFAFVGGGSNSGSALSRPAPCASPSGVSSARRNSYRLRDCGMTRRELD
jgi:hypothetical protein